MVSSGTDESFMNLESTYAYESSDPFTMMSIMVIFGDKKFIHQRQVYDFMAFLGDAGGIYGSMMLIGAVFHFCLSFDEQPAQFLKHYYRVNITDKGSKRKGLQKIKSGPATHLQESKSVKLSTYQVALHTTLMKVFLVICACFKGGKDCRKQQVLKRLLSKTAEQTEQYLDVRTLIRAQSLLFAHNSLLFERRHDDLLKL